MHLFLLTRGIDKEFNQWKEFMNSQMFTWKRTPLLKDKDGKFIKDGMDEEGRQKYKRGKEGLSRIQGALRPIQMFEYVFPREGVQSINGKLVPSDNLAEALAMMNLQSAFPLRPEVQKIGWMLRKSLGAKPIPQSVLDPIKEKNMQDITSKYVPMAGMAVYPIGIKEDSTHDYIFPNGEGFYQEGL